MLDELARRLEAEMGTGAVEFQSAGLPAFGVDGKLPRIHCAPADAEQIGAALRMCAEAGAAVIPWGGGTAMHLGNVPNRADVVLSLRRLNGLIEHDDANLTATVQGGMTVSAFQEALAGRGQFLAVDSPHPDAATIGGVVSANSNGPRRMLYGGVRDLVIGMKVVLASGERIKAGGKVVKNVAGYDMCKLFVGALGTLGVITEVTWKMAPLPETAATVVTRGPRTQALALADELLASPLNPAAIAVLDGLSGPGLDGRVPAVAVWAEGFAEAVSRHLADVQAMAGRAGLRAEVLTGDAHRRLWDAVRDFGAPAADGAVLVRVTVPLASVGAILTGVNGGARYVAHVGTGTVWIAVDNAAQGPAWFARLLGQAQEHRGHAVIASAPVALKAEVDVWGPPPPSLALMQALKREFDPHNVLNPGRFVARL